MATKVFLVDDHEVVRKGLREMLEAAGDFDVVGEAGTVADAISAIPAAHPDVAVLDVRLPDGNGVELCREVRSRQPEMGCLMLTSFSDDEALIDSIMAGASGYVLKQIRGGELIEAVRKVAAGQSLLDPVVAARVLDRVRRGDEADELLGRLTPQERRILDLVGRGLTNRQIADNLYLAEKTVKNYVSNLLTKMGMNRRTEAAAYIARLGERRSRRYDSPSEGAAPHRVDRRGAGPPPSLPPAQPSRIGELVGRAKPALVRAGARSMARSRPQVRIQVNCVPSPERGEGGGALVQEAVDAFVEVRPDQGFLHDLVAVGQRLVEGHAEVPVDLPLDGGHRGG